MSRNVRNEEVVVPIYRVLNVSTKVWRLLVKRTRNPVEAYSVLRFLCALFEDGFGLRVDLIDEAELHGLVEKVLNRDK